MLVDIFEKNIVNGSKHKSIVKSSNEIFKILTKLKS